MCWMTSLGWLNCGCRQHLLINWQHACGKSPDLGAVAAADLGRAAAAAARRSWDNTPNGVSNLADRTVMLWRLQLCMEKLRRYFGRGESYQTENWEPSLPQAWLFGDSSCPDLPR